MVDGHASNALVRVAFQGEHGAYSEAALKEYFGDNVIPIPIESFDGVFECVERGRTDLGMLPIENTLGGSIHANYDLLLMHELHVVGEHNFRVRHSLLVVPGTSLKDITHVHSHPQALAQCAGFLRKLGVRPCPEYDTAGSAKLISHSKQPGHAAIASSMAASFYGLNVLESGIEDDTNNFTRFLAVSRDKADAPGEGVQAKTSIVFSVMNQPGVLFKALSVFALRDIDLSKIESRPGFHRSRRYLASDDISKEQCQQVNTNERAAGNELSVVFYLDLLAGAATSSVLNALHHLSELAPFVRVLGSYPTLLGLGQSLISPSSSTPQLLPLGQETRSSEYQLRLGIVGFGNFGQFLARGFLEMGAFVCATSRSDYSAKAASMGVSWAASNDALLDLDPEFVIFSPSILSFVRVLDSFPVERMGGRVAVDVLSVKEYPKVEMLARLPADCDIICTHPMFGPESGRHGWHDLPFVYEKVRVRNFHRCARLLSLFEDKGCRMVLMSCEEHDRYAASSQFVAHLTGRMLGRLNIKSTPINTRGFDRLLQLVRNTSADSHDLFRALFLFNPNAQEQLSSLYRALDRTRLELITNNSVSTKEKQLLLPSPRIACIEPSKTGAITDLARSLKCQGKDIISLSVGEPDFEPPQIVMDAAKDAISRGHIRYTHNNGMPELRQAIAKNLKSFIGQADPFTADQILCSSGAKQSILLALMVLCHASHEVIIPAPYWVSYPEMVRLCGGEPVVVPTRLNDGFRLRADDLRAALTPYTRVVLLCNPNNPTGALYSAEQLRALAAVLCEYPDVWVIADEIYWRIFYEQSHTSFLSAISSDANTSSLIQRTVLIDGFSKAFAMTGFRIGFLAGPCALVAEAAKIQGHMTSCPCSISQHAALACLNGSIGEEFFRGMRLEFLKKRDFVIGALKAMSGVDVGTSPPGGAFYVFPIMSSFYGRKTSSGKLISGSEDLCMYLLEEHRIALVPGIAFGFDEGLRISFATSLDLLKDAMDRMAGGLAALII